MIMIMPLGDENRPGAGPHYVTWSLIAINVLVFFLELGMGEPFIHGYSTIPAEITQRRDLEGRHEIVVGGERYPLNHYPGPTPIYLTLLTSMFMHGGWVHLIGNMLYLWIFGDNVEDAIGHFRFLIYYLLCGFAASLAHIATDPNSIIPSLGASGAISGILGGYIVMFPTNRVRVMMGYVVTTVPAVIVLGLWIVLQFINGIAALSVATEQTAGVAFWAHIGGFVAGLILIFLFRIGAPAARRRTPEYQWR
jgi:membrane associated rhomboid family serine protease